MIERNEIAGLPGATVRDLDGNKIGKVTHVYLNDSTGQPAWATVKTGLFGTRSSFVPLAAGRLEGADLVVDTTKDAVSGAPQVDEDEHLSPAEEAELYRYYGLETGAPDPAGGPVAEDRRDPGRHSAEGGTADAMTRSEERLQVDTEQVEAGRARLRKHVVTDTETVQVPVSREEV